MSGILEMYWARGNAAKNREGPEIENWRRGEP